MEEWSLPYRTCHLWWAHIKDAHPSLLNLISDEEKERMISFREQDDRRRALISYAVLRLLLSLYLQVPPRTLQIDRTCNQCGKPHGIPRLIEPSSDLQFSVSHSGERVLFAVMRQVPVGVDVERVTPYIQADEMVHIVFNDEERIKWNTLPQERKKTGFCVYWTRKEAILKATGNGLVVPLTDLHVSAPDEPPRLIKWFGRDEIAAKIRLFDVSLSEEYPATLAVLGPCERIKVAEAKTIWEKESFLNSYF